AADLRRIVVDPILYGTLRELGLAALAEITAFEYMLARVAGRIARALARHRGLAPAALEWFTHHSEVDIRHAEEGLANLEAYLRYYEFPEAEALTIVEMTLRENVFVKRYFGALAAQGAREITG
ncbi:MAG: iron-containing redox enzyme family protein, partial [Candidatus Rokubacteria bacterium]|nr:iron-containing redox enzyme family protein [Candidatus Rokubacteria bacterium]